MQMVARIAPVTALHRRLCLHRTASCDHVLIRSPVPICFCRVAQPARKRQVQAQKSVVDKEAAVQLYSPTAVHIADVMELLPLLNRMTRLEAGHAAAVDIEHVRRKMMARLQLARLEVSGLVAEIECEVQRADQIQDRLKDIQTTRITSQTILGIIFGGLENILSGGIGMAAGAGDAGNIVAVAGGPLEVLFGTSANFTKVRQKFSHPHNHLAAVWYGSRQSDFFSGRAWRLLLPSRWTRPWMRRVRRSTSWGGPVRIIADVSPFSPTVVHIPQVPFIEYSNMSNLDQRAAGLPYTMRKVVSK